MLLPVALVPALVLVLCVVISCSAVAGRLASSIASLCCSTCTAVCVCVCKLVCVVTCDVSVGAVSAYTGGVSSGCHTDERCVDAETLPSYDTCTHITTKELMVRRPLPLQRSRIDACVSRLLLWIVFCTLLTCVVACCVLLRLVLCSVTNHRASYRPHVGSRTLALMSYYIVVHWRSAIDCMVRKFLVRMTVRNESMRFNTNNTYRSSMYNSSKVTHNITCHDIIKSVQRRLSRDSSSSSHLTMLMCCVRFPLGSYLCSLRFVTLTSFLLPRTQDSSVS